jgi:hypothetical protein
MSLYRVSSPRQSWYDEFLGILVLDAADLCIPANVGNVSTASFPVRCKEAVGACIERLLNQRDTTLVQPLADTAKALSSEGVRVVTGVCGFMARFQRQAAATPAIPTIFSSLLQIPVIHTIIRRIVVSL